MKIWDSVYTYIFSKNIDFFILINFIVHFFAIAIIACLDISILQFSAENQQVLRSGFTYYYFFFFFFLHWLIWLIDWFDFSDFFFWLIAPTLKRIEGTPFSYSFFPETPAGHSTSSRRACLVESLATWNELIRTNYISIKWSCSILNEKTLIKRGNDRDSIRRPLAPYELIIIWRISPLDHGAPLGRK